METLCKYKDVLGKPREGIHSWRLGGLAGADLLLTAAAAYLLSGKSVIGFLLIFCILILVAAIVHHMFCVNTELNRRLGLHFKE